MNAHEKERNEMLSNIDEEKIKTLQEQPVKIDFRKELESIEFMGVNDARDSETIARHFYELGRQSKPRIVFSKEVFDQYDREQFINAYRPKVCEGLEEEIERWFEEIDKYTPFNFTDIGNTARHFAKWQKEQMMKDAVEGKVVTTNKYTSVRYLSRYGTFRYFYGIGSGFQKGDKVKLIIIKED